MRSLPLNCLEILAKIPVKHKIQLFIKVSQTLLPPAFNSEELEVGTHTCSSRDEMCLSCVSVRP